MIELIVISCFILALFLLFILCDFLYAGISAKPSNAIMAFSHKFLHKRFSVIIRRESVNDRDTYTVHMKSWIFPTHSIRYYEIDITEYAKALRSANDTIQSERENYDKRFLKTTKNIHTIKSI